jgi:hypothetical protein
MALLRSTQRVVKRDYATVPGVSNVDELNPVEDLARTLRRVHSRYLWAVLVMFTIASAIGTAAVFMNPVRDWMLFLAMYLVIFAYMITYIKAHQQRRRARRFAALAATEALLTFWCFILTDRIPGRLVFHDGQVQDRAEMPMLWGSVACMTVVGALLIVHWAWIGRFSERAADAMAAGHAQPSGD